MTVLQDNWQANEEAQDWKASRYLNWRLAHWVVTKRHHDGDRYWYEIRSRSRGETKQLRHRELLKLADTVHKTGLVMSPME